MKTTLQIALLPALLLIASPALAEVTAAEKHIEIGVVTPGGLPEYNFTFYADFDKQQDSQPCKTSKKSLIQK